MKKVLMTLIAALAICGFSFAQESHWSDFNLYQYQFNLPLVAFVQIDGEYVTVDNYTNFEIAAFVGDQCRGHMFMDDYTEDGDPYPIVEINYYYTTTGDVVTFQMWDHTTGTLYETCNTNREIITGEDDVELYFDYDNALIMNFISGDEPQPMTFTKDIIGYGADYDPETNDKANYYLIASPIGTVNPADDTKVQHMLENGYDFYAFNQTQAGAEWQAYDEANFELEAGKGYLYANIEDVTLTFTGMPYDGEGEVTLVKQDYPFSGWNLIGNPFAEAAYLDKPYYVLNESGNGVMTETLSGEIEPMSGCFVYADEDGETVTFSTAEPETSANLALNLSSNSSVIDRAIVRFGEGSTLPKFQLHANDTKLYIPVDGEDFAVVNAQEVGEMPVNFKAEKNGYYTISFTSQEVNFNYLHLIDNMTGADVDLLATQSYTFNAQSTDYASRFRLVFATGNSNDDNFAFFNNGNLVISNDGKATLQVVDVTGRILSSETISGSTSINMNAAAGVYMIRLINGDNIKVQKMVVK